MTLNKKRKGFTLIELILVMSIILVISSLLMPKLNGYSSKAQVLKVVDTGRQIYMAAMESYTSGNEQFDKTKLTTSVKSLLGIDLVDVANNAGEVTISYKVDEKGYSINFNTTSSNSFTVKDSGGTQIYPK
ncbi:putative major pilin subunit [Clostridium homopropionicum DSM 5847]|uniref:Putative major pilin subunit n=1 Tax=Clostridium homopropionicum DSM 5847 TaxID=1121318 RepID=A0A0L6ZD97_9CLOT|nr:type II secretion system protein [Clostridium homopropionicum]KOA20959.1 putative major pilin subunit [Clostridium homopropionicum DSM 5847]SFG01103.1 type IV pilus assembly protein PilA [Clostridium homopropionicum]